MIGPLGLRLTTQINVRSNDVDFLLDLDTRCRRCHGLGETYNADGEVQPGCTECHGTGFVMTDAGRTLLTFVRRHYGGEKPW